VNKTNFQGVVVALGSKAPPIIEGRVIQVNHIDSDIRSEMEKYSNGPIIIICRASETHYVWDQGLGGEDLLAKPVVAVLCTQGGLLFHGIIVIRELIATSPAHHEHLIVGCQFDDEIQHTINSGAYIKIERTTENKLIVTRIT